MDVMDGNRGVRLEGEEGGDSDSTGRRGGGSEG